MTKMVRHTVNILQRFRVRISGTHCTKYEGILSFCEALSHRSNINAERSISFLAPKFHLITMFKQDNVLRKHLISWQNLILQPPHQVNFRAVYLTSFICYVFNFLYFSLTLFYITLKCSCVKKLFQKNFYQCQISKFLSAANFYGTMLFCYTIFYLKLDVPWGHIKEKKLFALVSWRGHIEETNFTPSVILQFLTVIC